MFFSQDMRAGHWYSVCSTLLIANSDEIEKFDIDTRKEIRQCKLIAAKVWCENDFEGGPEADTLSAEQLENINNKLKDYCPSNFDLPLGGIHFIPLNYWETKGGIPVWKRWSSAESVVLEAFKDKWPSCTEKRRELGLIHKGEKEKYVSIDGLG